MKNVIYTVSTVSSPIQGTTLLPFAYLPFILACKIMILCNYVNQFYQFELIFLIFPWTPTSRKRPPCYAPSVVAFEIFDCIPNNSWTKRNCACFSEQNRIKYKTLLMCRSRIAWDQPHTNLGTQFIIK